MGKALLVLVTGALLLALFAGAAAARVFIGTNGDDDMTGTDYPAGDVIRTLDGRDTVDARGGDDIVDGGRGSDGGMDGPALFADSPDHTTDSDLDANGYVTVAAGHARARHAVHVVLQRPPHLPRPRASLLGGHAGGAVITPTD